MWMKWTQYVLWGLSLTFLMVNLLGWNRDYRLRPSYSDTVGDTSTLHRFSDGYYYDSSNSSN